MNMRNFGLIEGRLTRDPQILKNADGSRKVMFTVAARRDFAAADGTKESDFIPVEAFVKADKPNGVYDLIHKGDLVGIEYTVRSSTYTDSKTGEKKYSLVHLVRKVDLKENKATTEARQAQGTPVAVPADAEV